MTSQPPESRHPDVTRMIGGVFREGPEYSTWRTAGTADFLLIHTIDGAGRFGSSGGDVTVGPGDAVLLRPGVRHDYGTAPCSTLWALAFAHFHPRAEWVPLLDWPDDARGFGLVRTDGELHRRVTASLGRAARGRVGSPARAELFGMNALEEALLWLDTQNPLRARTDERVLRVVEHVSAHPAEALDVERLAEIAHLSPSRLSHLFMRHIGSSPRQYVERERMLLACQLLDLTNRSVSSIAGEVGFDDPLYFSQRFRRFAGLSPRAYRQRGDRVPSAE